MAVRRVLWQDALRIARYGFSAPRKFQRLYVNTDRVRFDGTNAFRESVGGSALELPETLFSGDWDQNSRSVQEHATIAVMMRRIQDGLSWQAAGEYEIVSRMIDRHGSWDGCSTLGDIEARCGRLDSVIEQVRTEWRLRSQKELAPGSFRERGGIGVLVGRDALIHKGWDGSHRLGLALALKLPFVPVSVQAVHKLCLEGEQWENLLEESRKIQQAANQ